VLEGPRRASDYTTESHAAVRAGLLHLATVLGDLLDDVMVVGGMVPGLITTTLDDELLGPHVGTTDVDIALALAVLDADRYREVAEGMRRAGFHPDVNDDGNQTVQRWVLHDTLRVTVDFLIPQASGTPPAQRVHHLESEFGALVTRGLSDAMTTCVRVALEGRTLDGAEVERALWVCGPAGFVVLKALAFRNRGEGKDAYDLYYVLKHHDLGPIGIARELQALRANDPAEPDAIDDAIAILREDFLRFEGLGPTRAAAFLGNDLGDEVRADVTAHVTGLLNGLQDARDDDGIGAEPLADESS
jgi:hypothetical protein